MKTKTDGFDPNGVDKRILKTRHAVRSAFRQLIQQKEMSEITISELTKAANITRSTFYMYYSDVSDVCDEMENEVLRRMEVIIKDMGINNCIKNPYPVLSVLTQEIMRVDEYNKYMVNGKNSSQLIGKIKTRIVDLLTDYIAAKGTADIMVIRYVATFITAGILDTYKEWYNNNGISLEEMCRYCSNIILNGQTILKLAGIDLPLNRNGENPKLNVGDKNGVIDGGV